jgi:hypothetical protein
MSFKKITTSDFLGRVDDFILDEETEREFERVVGGYAWPSAVKPGFAVVIGEDRQEDELYKKRHWRILAETENQSPKKLIKRCAELNSFYSVEAWYGDTENRAMMEFLYDSRHRFHLIDAPFLDEPNVFEKNLLLIMEVVSSGNKTLHFGKESNLRSILNELTTEDMLNSPKTAFQKYPQIAALGFVVSALEYYKCTFAQQQREVDRLTAELAVLHDDY